MIDKPDQIDGATRGNMRVLLVARHKRARRYFDELARISTFSMEVVTPKTLPLLMPAFWPWLWVADTDNAIAYHVARKNQLNKTNNVPVTWKLCGLAKKLRAAICYAQFIQLLKELTPSALIIWNGSDWFCKCASQAARELGIQEFYAENGLMPDTLTLDPKGINNDSSIPRDPEFYRSISPLRHAFNTKLKPRCSLKKEAVQAVDLPERYIFVPLQVNKDSQIVLNSPWLTDMHDFIRTLLAASLDISDQDIKFVIKEHPNCQSDYSQYYTSSQNRESPSTPLGARFVFASGNNTQELIERAECIITINSTVGVESLLIGKKVILVGNAFYDIPGLVISAKSKTELVNAVNSISTWRVDEALRENLLSYLVDIYCIPGDRDQVDAKHIARVEERIINVLERGLPL